MAEDQRDIPKEFQSFCDGLTSADMIQKVVEGKTSCHSSNWAEMVSRMMQRCLREKGKKGGPLRKPMRIPLCPS